MRNIRQLTTLAVSVAVAFLVHLCLGGKTALAPNDAVVGQPASVSRPTAPDEVTQAQVREIYGKLPLSFEANHGQTDQQVKFLARGSGYTLFLACQEAVLTLNGGAAPLDHTQPTRDAQPPIPSVLRMKLVGASPGPSITGQEELPGQSNYFVGNNPQQWRTHIAHYGKVRYEGVYPGVDLLYSGNNQGQLEYDFVVGSNADPGAIKLSFAGMSELRLGEDGDLVLGVAGGEIHQLKPVIYQEVEGVRKEIAGGYRIEGQGQVSFEVGSYDESRPLVIDPVLVYSSYLGGSGIDQGLGIAVDEDGSAYVTGNTSSPDFPTTAGGFQPAIATFSDVFVTKLNGSGTALVYSTYLGGSSNDQALAIALDEKGSAYVTGHSDSPDFPTTASAYQPANAGGFGDVFVTKLNGSGTALVYSTYLGGRRFELALGIAVDEDGSAHVAGHTESLDFPTTGGAIQPTYAGGPNDAFVTKLNGNGTALVYSSYLGGSGNDQGLAVVEDGSAYVAGSTDSLNFPTTAGAFQPANAGGSDGFVAKLNRSGTAMVYSTYLGGSGFDIGRGIAVDEDGSAYVTGRASSNFPTTGDVFQPVFAGSSDAFVTKLNRSGTALVYSTYLGGSGFDIGLDIPVDEDGSAYVAGSTDSLNFPTTAGAFQPANAGLSDVFVTKLNRSGTALVYSTYLGGSRDDLVLAVALDEDGSAYVAGLTESLNFPTTASAFQPTMAGGLRDAFVAKIGDVGDDEDDDGDDDDGDDDDGDDIDTLRVEVLHGGYLLLTWEVPNVHAEIDITGYRVLRRDLLGGSWELLAEVTGHSYVLPISGDSQSYLLNVMAITEAP